LMLFFFETRQNIFHFYWLRRSLKNQTHLTKSQAQMNLAYSRVMTLLKALAPARLHMATSSFIYQTNIFEVEASFRNTRAFLSFQISHEINIASDDMSFFHCPCLCTPSIHHSLTERIVLAITYVHLV
jgi:hypothetical protein